MKWVKPTEEMPARYKVILFAIDYPPEGPATDAGFEAESRRKMT